MRSVTGARISAGLLVAALVATALPAQSRAPVDVQALGPQVGDVVPDFRLPDQHGVERSLDQIMGPRGALILFYRSADW